MAHLLRYSCKPRLYRITADGDPFEGEIREIRVYESLEPSDHERAEEGVSDYRIVIEAEVESGKEARKLRSFVFDLARELERVWTFVVGEPLFPIFVKGRQIDAPENWETNYGMVKERLAEEGRLGMTAEIEDWSSRGWREFPIYPLEQALKVRRNYHGADERIRYLVDIFHEYERTAERHAELLVLAKCVEVIGDMAGGRSGSPLPTSAVGDIPLSFDDLKDLQNTRRELRHPTRPDGTLWPELSSQEENEYRESAEIGVRDFLADRLGGNTVRRTGK